jgi:hypothetical protein
MVDTAETFQQDFNVKKQTVVASIDTSVYWRQFIKNILPESSQGIVIVFENACTASFTYQVL